MDLFRKHQRFWKIIAVIAGLALVLSSFVPLLTLL